jgi:Cdc6-like AAA superfamily ATPase
MFHFVLFPLRLIISYLFTYRALYISGVPGVGKTAIVNKVVRELMLLSTDSDLPQFKYIFLNGMKLNKPEKIYNQLLQVTISFFSSSFISLNSKAINHDEINRKRSAKMACKLLSKYFTDRMNKKKQAIVLLLDEVIQSILNLIFSFK